MSGKPDTARKMATGLPEVAPGVPDNDIMNALRYEKPSALSPVHPGGATSSRDSAALVSVFLTQARSHVAASQQRLLLLKSSVIARLSLLRKDAIGGARPATAYICRSGHQRWPAAEHCSAGPSHCDTSTNSVAACPACGRRCRGEGSYRHGQDSGLPDPDDREIDDLGGGVARPDSCAGAFSDS